MYNGNIGSISAFFHTNSSKHPYQLFQAPIPTLSSTHTNSSKHPYQPPAAP